MVVFEQARLLKLGSVEEPLALQNLWSSNASLPLLAEPDSQVGDASLTSAASLPLALAASAGI